MNIEDRTRRLQAVTAVLGELGLQVVPAEAPPGIADEPGALWLRIGPGPDAQLYGLEIRRMVTAEAAGGLIAQLRDRTTQTGRPVLLIADYVTPPLADRLRAHGQPFVDAAGNVFLAGGGLFVFVTGRRPKQRPATARGPGALTVNGLKVMFALLCDAALADAPQRRIAAAAGVALGAVPAVLGDLERAGHVVTLAGRRRFLATKRQLDDWAQGYARRLRPKTLQDTFVTEHFDAWRGWVLDPAQVRWGGEPAAALLTDYLRPGVLTLYAERLPARLVVEQRLIREERPARERYVELRRPFWGDLPGAPPHPGVVPPVLVYADLLATGDGRCMETAQMLYENHLARLLPAG